MYTVLVVQLEEAVYTVNEDEGVIVICALLNKQSETTVTAELIAVEESAKGSEDTHTYAVTNKLAN